jgi:site-specific recombinase XerD
MPVTGNAWPKLAALRICRLRRWRHGRVRRPSLRFLPGLAARTWTPVAVASFLDHIESQRSNSTVTRNCRRAAIRSFFKHLPRNDLEHAQQYLRALAIPSKKARHRVATYLEADDMRAIIAHPDRRRADGWRDYTLLLFLYNCGARVSEALDDGHQSQRHVSAGWPELAQ